MTTTKDIVTTDQAVIVRTKVLPADQNPVLVYLAGLSEGSRRTMGQALDTIAHLVSHDQVDAVALDWSRMRFQHTAAIRSRLAETYAPATANKMLSALRGVLKASWKLGQMSAEDYHRAREVEAIKGETLPAGRSISAGELSALMNTCARDQGLAGVRDAAIVALLYSCGLRRAELVGLDVEDYDAEARTLAIRQRGRGAGPKRGK